MYHPLVYDSDVYNIKTRERVVFRSFSSKKKTRKTRPTEGRDIILLRIYVRIIQNCSWSAHRNPFIVYLISRLKNWPGNKNTHTPLSYTCIIVCLRCVHYIVFKRVSLLRTHNIRTTIVMYYIVKQISKKKKKFTNRRQDNNNIVIINAA